MALQWNDVGDFVEDVLQGYGTELQASGQDAVAKTNLNNATAKLVEAKAQSEKERNKTINTAIIVAVVGIVVVLFLLVLGKTILPKLLK